MKILIFLTAVAVVAAGALWSGIYNISALDPHWEITLKIIEIARDRSIIAHSADARVPQLDDPKLFATGAREFHETCRACHGAPGEPSEVFAQGLYPAPANLLSGNVQKDWNNNQLYWIVENGLKMTGMPAFGATQDKNTLYAIVAFLKRLPGMSPEQYRTVAGAANGGGGAREAPVPNQPQGAP